MISTAILGWLFAAYALFTGIYIVLENRRPQATFAWMLLLLVLPGLGVLIYVLFGRAQKAFSRQRVLAEQESTGKRSAATEGASGTAECRNR